MNHNETQRQEMLALARDSIAYQLALQPAPAAYAQLPAYLQQTGASFVTLEIQQKLRGCIGSIEAYRPLGEDLIENAAAAALHDPRFPPLTAGEYPDTTIKLSILTSPEPMQFDSEIDLLRQLLPGMDGLILSEGARRGTFLPSVWEQLPNPADFLNHLKQKAGLPANYWSDTIQIARYRTEQFS